MRRTRSRRAPPISPRSEASTSARTRTPSNASSRRPSRCTSALELLDATPEASPRSVAAVLGNLATIYDAQERPTLAEPLLKRELAIEEKALGAEHLDIANTVIFLARLYENVMRLEEAEQLFKRALAIRKKALGPDDPAVGRSRTPSFFARSLKNIASVYRRLGRNEDAEKLERRATAILAKRPAGP
jgi:tetratricopeptide (TPR) repeat protein